MTMATLTETSGFVAVGGVATGSLEVVGDRDWFRVDLEQEKLITFHSTGIRLVILIYIFMEKVARSWLIMMTTMDLTAQSIIIRPL